jgi:hypothetical protein
LFIIYCLFTFVRSLFVCSFVHCCLFIHRWSTTSFVTSHPCKLRK